MTGGSLIGQKLVDFTERLAGNVLFAGLLGPVSLGRYTFSTQLSRFSVEAAGNPAWAAIYAQALRGGLTGRSPFYTQLCRFMGILLLPGTLLIAAAAPHLVSLLLGAAWMQAALIIRVILPTYAAVAISAQVGALLLAHGRNDIVLWSSCLASAGRVLAIASGYWLGPAGVAIGVAAANLIYCVVVQSLAARIVDCRPAELLQALAGPLAAGAAGAAVLLIVIPADAGLLAVTSCLLVAAAASLATLAIVDRRRLRVDLAAVRRLIRR